MTSLVTSYDSDDIIEMSVMEGMRHNKSMYVGEANVSGQNQIVKEPLDNSIDEMELIRDKNRFIDISIHFKDTDKYQVRITDRGRGIPHVKLKAVTTKLHASGKFKQKAYKTSIGTYGVGLKVTMALSESAMVITKHDEKLSYICFNKGNILDVNTTESFDKNIPDGTTIIFEPDGSIFTDMDKFESVGVTQLVEYLRFLCVFSDYTNIRCYLTDTYLNIPKLSKQINSGSLKLSHITPKKSNVLFEKDLNLTFEKYIKEQFDTNSPTVWAIDDLKRVLDDEDENDKVGFDIKLMLTKNCKVNKRGILSTINMHSLNDPNSDHIMVLNNCIKEKLEFYIDDVDVRTYFKLNYRLPVYTVVKIKYKGASFINHTKTAFKDKDFALIYATHLRNKLSNFSNDTWAELYNLISEDIDNKYREYFNKGYIKSKDFKNLAFDLEKVKSFISCSCKDPSLRELFIVEGRSAKDSSRLAADSAFQAIFSIRGKPVNGIQKTREAFKKDVVISDLIQIIGVNPEQKDLSTLRFNKIFILADADHHGFHICALMIGNLYKINPLLLTEGKVFIVNPPLYSLTLNSKTIIYLKDYNALMETRINNVYKFFLDIELKLNSEEHTENFICLKDDKYDKFINMAITIATIIEKASSVIGTDASIIEILLRNTYYDGYTYKLHEDKVKQELGSEAIHWKGDSIFISKEDTDLFVPWKRYTEECDKYLYNDYMKFSAHLFEFFITTTKNDKFKRHPMLYTTLKGILTELDKKLGKYEYFKGLGEMDPPKLRKTCFDPTTRSTIKIKSLLDLEKFERLLSKDTFVRKELINKRIED